MNPEVIEHMFFGGDRGFARIILTGFFAMLLTGSAALASGDAIVNISVLPDEERSQVVISGQLLSGREDVPVVIAIRRSGSDFADVNALTVYDLIIHYDQKQTGPGGQFSFRVSDRLEGSVYPYSLLADTMEERLDLTLNITDLSNLAFVNLLRALEETDEAGLYEVLLLYDPLLKLPLDAQNGFSMLDAAGRTQLLQTLRSQQTVGAMQQSYFHFMALSAVHTVPIDRLSQVLIQYGAHLGISFEDDAKLLSGDNKALLLRKLYGERFATVDAFGTFYRAERDKLTAPPAPASSGGGPKGGGFAGPVTSAPVPPVDTHTDTAPASTEAGPPDFADLDPVPWARDAILRLAEKGIVSGVSATAFAPERSITREEFLKLLAAAFRLEASGQGTAFADVSPDAWYAPYVAGAISSGIVTGISDTQFGVGQPITRQDAAVMAYRALSFRGTAPRPGLSGIPLPQFYDADDISAYAREAVEFLYFHSIMQGVDHNSFAPDQQMSRAMGAVMILRMLDASATTGEGI